jgi:hypothetical protein
VGLIMGLVSDEEILEMKKEAYECNDARLMAVARALESAQEDPYATCTVLLQAFRMLAKDHRGIMEKLVEAVKYAPIPPITIKEKT